MVVGANSVARRRRREAARREAARRAEASRAGCLMVRVRVVGRGQTRHSEHC